MDNFRWKLLDIYHSEITPVIYKQFHATHTILEIRSKLAMENFNNRNNRRFRMSSSFFFTLTSHILFLNDHGDTICSGLDAVCLAGFHYESILFALHQTFIFLILRCVNDNFNLSIRPLYTLWKRQTNNTQPDSTTLERQTESGHPAPP